MRSTAQFIKRISSRAIRAPLLFRHILRLKMQFQIFQGHARILRDYRARWELVTKLSREAILPYQITAIRQYAVEPAQMIHSVIVERDLLRVFAKGMTDVLKRRPG